MNENKRHKDEGFGIPENYFENLEEKLRDRAALDELMPAKEGYEVPERYFNNFETELRKKLSRDQGRVRYLNLAKKGLAIAASFLGVIFLSTLFFNRNGDFSFDQVETADIEWLMEQGALEVPEIFLMEQAESINLNDISMNTDPINTQALEDYLLDEIDVYEVLDDSLQN